MPKVLLTLPVCVIAIAIQMVTPAKAIDPSRNIEQLQHSSWTVRDGAPTYVQMMAQTDDGFLWFGTSSGLVRFDGIQFERYVLANGRPFPESPIRSLYALPDNGLLVGWFFGGVTLVRNGRAIEYGANDGYPTGTTYGFARDRSGSIWAAVSGGLARFDGKRWQRISHEWNFEGQRAIAIFLDRDGTLGAFTDETLMTLADGASAFKPTGGKVSTRVPVVQSRSGALYVSESRGVRSIASLSDYDRGAERWIVKFAEPGDWVPMLVDRDGGLWFVPAEGVARVPNPEDSQRRVEYFTRASGLSDEEANQIFEDREGSVWVTTANGVDRFRAGPFLRIVGASRPSFPAMIPSPDGGLWLAGANSSLYHVAREGSMREVADLNVSCAYLDSRGVGWFGSTPPSTRTAELWRLDKNSIRRVPLPPDIPVGFDVQAVALDASGSLWVSIIRDGIRRYVNGQWQRPRELLDEGNRAAVAMKADAKGRVWLGYVDNRVSLWENGSVRIYSTADGLNVGNVFALHENGKHLWVAGDRGLALLLSDGFRNLNTVEPNVLHNVTGVIETATGDLWLHALDGAIHVRREEVQRAIAEPHHRMNYRLFNYADGLTGAPAEIRPMPTLVQGTDGRLWFGTRHGAFVLDPAAISINQQPPSVIIKAARAGSIRYQMPVSLRLPALTSNLEFDYTTTRLAAAHRVRFRYRLSGVDRGWQEAGTRRQAFYTNLGPGQYRFYVIAANEDGVWNTAGDTVAFTIAPAWYQSVWFFVICGLVAIGAMTFLYRARVHRLRTQLQSRLQERLLERERIARELHDTLIQSFQGLVLTLSGAARRIPPEDPARTQMEKALTRADAALAEGRDRVRDLRTPMTLEGDLGTIIKESANDLALLHPPANFELSTYGAPRALHPVALEEAYRIGREALANAYGHANASYIGVEIDYGTRQLRLHVRDDGKGIDADILAKGGIPGHWGMTGMRERAQKLGARLLVRSGAGSGTEIELDIPAAVAYREHEAGSWYGRLLLHMGRGLKRHDN